MTNIIQWKLVEDSRLHRCVFIGPQDCYFTVRQLKIDQRPFGETKISFTGYGVDFLQPNRESELMRALQDALAVAREWSQPVASSVTNV